MTALPKSSGRMQALALAGVILLPGGAVARELTAVHGFVIRNWDTEEGLPTSSVLAVAKTPDGYLWIGTPSGLVRYDGIRFRTYSPRNTPALSDAFITCLYTDRGGSLWVGTHDGGLVRRATNALTRLSLGTNPPRSAVTGLIESPSGVMWGTLEQAGVFAYRDGRTDFYSTNHGLPSPMVWGITADTRGDLWVVSRWRLMRFQDGTWRGARGLPSDFPRVCAIAPGADGGLWIACMAQTGAPIGDRGARMFKYVAGQLTEDPFPPPWSQDSRRSLPRVLIEDRRGRLWCSTRGAGVFMRDAKQWQLFSESPSLSQAQAASIFEDEDSAIWLGMDGTGLHQLRPAAVTTFEPPLGISPGCFWTVYPGRDGSVWGGTDGNGIFRWKAGVMTQYRAQEGLSNAHVNAIIEDRRTNLWAGTMGGLFRQQGSWFAPCLAAETLQLPVYSLKEDRSGRIWVGTRNGLVALGASATNVFRQEQGIPFGPINAIEEDANGRIWVSIPPYRDGRAPGPVGPYGLFASSGSRFEHIAEHQWGGEPNIRSLQADADGNLWIGTIGTGFFRFHEGRFTEFSLDDGLPHGRIQAVVQDRARNLWFCSELGVFGSPLEQLVNHTRARNARLNWWRIQRTDGLPNKAATGNGQPSAALGPDGRIWFANGSSIAGFDPRVLTRTARLRPPVIEEILVNGVAQALEADGRMRVTASARRIEIRYTSPNTSTPDLPTFWTRLKGFDTDWVSGGITRAASYSLQPGNYAFSVAVTGPDGSRIETPAPLAIEVVPRFWERRPVRFLAGLLVVATVALGVWRWEKARSRDRLRQLEIQRAMDQVRQRIARDIHDDLGSGLTEITLLSDNLRGEIREAGPSGRTVERIAARARALTREMDEVVWAINPRTDTLESLATYLNDFAQERLALAGIRCRLHTATDLPDMELSADVRHSLYRAAKEALNNAIKHAGASEVAITIEPRDHDLLCILQDDGRGFDPRQALKRGNGLENMRLRLEEIGGSCAIESRIGRGTTVSFRVPANGQRAVRVARNGDDSS